MKALCALALSLAIAGAHGEQRLSLAQGKPVSLRILAATMRAGGT
jgi:hypothetical protein